MSKRTVLLLPGLLLVASGGSLFGYEASKYSLHEEVPSHDGILMMFAILIIGLGLFISLMWWARRPSRR